MLLQILTNFFMFLQGPTRSYLFLNILSGSNKFLQFPSSSYKFLLILKSYFNFLHVPESSSRFTWYFMFSQAQESFYKFWSRSNQTYIYVAKASYKKATKFLTLLAGMDAKNLDA